ncbi:hypothetical protein [uncultured Nostoc sp.]
MSEDLSANTIFKGELSGRKPYLGDRIEEEAGVYLSDFILV